MKTESNEGSQDRTHWYVRGVIRWDDSNEPVIIATVNLYISDPAGRRLLGTGKTDQRGGYIVSFAEQAEADSYGKSCDCHLTVLDRSGRTLLSTNETPLRVRGGQTWEINLLIPAEARRLSNTSKRRVRPLAQVGP